MLTDPPTGSAQTSVPIHPPIAHRWSPLAFDPQAQVSAQEITALGGRTVGRDPGRSPARRGSSWVGAVSRHMQRCPACSTAAATPTPPRGALILVCADEGDDQNTTLYSSAVDAGAAEANLITEAVSRADLPSDGRLRRRRCPGGIFDPRAKSAR